MPVISFPPRIAILGVLSMIAIFLSVVAVLAQTAPPPWKQPPQEYGSRQDRWNRAHITWSIVHYALGIAATVLSVAVASAGENTLTRRKRVRLSFAAAVCAALLTFLSPSAHAKTYRDAWRIVDSAMRKYKADDIRIQDVNVAVDEAEKLIAETSPF